MYNPKSSYNLLFAPPKQFKMMMDRTHAKDFSIINTDRDYLNRDRNHLDTKHKAKGYDKGEMVRHDAE